MKTQAEELCADCGTPLGEFDKGQYARPWGPPVHFVCPKTL